VSEQARYLAKLTDGAATLRALAQMILEPRTLRGFE
jgi:hypothetical protein